MIRERLWLIVKMADAWWDYGDPFERITVGGVLLCLLAMNTILLDEVLSSEQAAELLVSLGPLGEFNVEVLLAVMIGVYMIRPGRLYARVRDREETSEKH